MYFKRGIIVLLGVLTTVKLVSLYRTKYSKNKETSPTKTEPSS